MEAHPPAPLLAARQLQSIHKKELTHIPRLHLLWVSAAPHQWAAQNSPH